ncbi:MAG: hypothetical protein COY40_04165 [Alphaproteobacteria bacterium CG_4_10_14_0_8_um_filter_53_9]|nr:MAG: hypothetical protein COY40_04165 [Alphaproteobacteria bacterium CG_4_10_14_0_8_um_filter_53_9]
MGLRHPLTHTVILSAVLAVSVLGGVAYGQEEYAADPYNPQIARESWELIGKTEKAYNVPPGLLHAMSLVESGKGIKGWLLPWPYTVCINSTGTKSYSSVASATQGLGSLSGLGFVRFDATINGKAYTGLKKADVQSKLAAVSAQSLVSLKPRPFSRRFENGAEAEKFVNRMFAMGHNNMDLGLMQINWKVHGKKLGSVHHAFNPTVNVNYAVNYLLEHRQTRDWWGSVGRYHSGTSYYANKYITRVWKMYQRVHRLT